MSSPAKAGDPVPAEGGLNRDLSVYWVVRLADGGSSERNDK